jgi:UDP-N-acetylglucosamine 2-epimerase (non-hydrolysing)
MARRVLLIFGTRPEAIKLAPLAHTLAADPDLDVRVCVTAQHRQMLDQVLALFELRPHVDLDVMTQGQTLPALTSAVLTGVARVLREERPELVIVQGDTTTTFASALAAFYERAAVGHVEAGLRTGNLAAPWPEEANRVLTSALTALHFAPTQRARRNLEREGVARSSIVVTGNTVVDALVQTRARLDASPALAAEADRLLPALPPSQRLVLVTGHRRESFGQGFRNICAALRTLAAREDVAIVYPVHPNPQVSSVVHEELGRLARVHLIAPLEYPSFVRLLSRARLVLTDSGGVQEEAPALGVPALVMRDTTERPEAVEAGCVRLVGTETGVITAAVNELLDDPQAHARMARADNPYGDGQASLRIRAAIRRHFGLPAGNDLAEWAR